MHISPLLQTMLQTSNVIKPKSKPRKRILQTMAKTFSKIPTTLDKVNGTKPKPKPRKRVVCPITQQCDKIVPLLKKYCRGIWKSAALETVVAENTNEHFVHTYLTILKMVKEINALRDFVVISITTPNQPGFTRRFCATTGPLVQHQAPTFSIVCTSRVLSWLTDSRLFDVYGNPRINITKSGRNLINENGNGFSYVEFVIGFLPSQESWVFRMRDVIACMRDMQKAYTKVAERTTDYD